jgi:hypothetical protein
MATAPKHKPVLRCGIRRNAEADSGIGSVHGLVLLFRHG